MDDATGTIDETLESGYNVRARREDYDGVLADWVARSESFRSAAGGALDVRYGPAERQRLDIFTAGTGAPTLIYLHGGYWQRGDKSIYSFVAEPFLDRGVNIIVLGYSLCPDVRIAAIVDEIRASLVWLYREGSRYGLEPNRINVTGHSAGGHLTAMMLATNWTSLGSDLPVDLVKSGIPISGLYDLDPLRRTSINQAAGIDEETADRASPLFLRPVSGVPVLAVVGGAETLAFHEQTEDFVKRWTAAGTRMEHYVEPDADHFDVVNRLADGQSGLFGRTLDWLVLE